MNFGLQSLDQFGGGNGVIVSMENNGSTFGTSTPITFPVVGSSGVSHPHETIQVDNELLVPDLVSIECPHKLSKFSNSSLFREVIPFGGSYPTKAEPSRSEERSHSLPGVARATLQFTTTFWSLFTNSQAPSPRNSSHPWARTARISSPTFLSCRRIKLLSQGPLLPLRRF